jgi:hypothetical protein
MIPEGRHAARTTKNQPPAYVRVAGGLSLGLGLVFIAWISLAFPWIAGPGALMVVGGAGLILGQRWAWPILALTAIPWFYAAYVFFLPESQTDPFELDHPFGAVFLAVGLLLLLASVTRATRSWLAGRPVKH